MIREFKPVSRRSLLAGGMAVAAAALLSGAAAQAQPRGELVIATSMLSQNADPISMISTGDYVVFEKLFDGLINLNDKGKYPALAESWVISPDGKQIDFKLRQNVKFHNGDPFTAEDVKFTFEQVVAPESTHSYRRAFQDSLERIDVVDPHTARFILKQPWPSFFTTSRYAYTSIVPKDYYLKVGAKGFKEKPVGTGPFKLAEWKAGEYTKFEANADYWGLVPKVKFVTEKLVAEPFTRYAMLERGEADIITGLTGALLERVRTGRNKDLRIIMSPYAGSSGLLFNKKEFPQAEDRRVRLAIAHALNRKAIAENVLGNVCEPSAGILSPGTFGYLEGLPLIPYDPAKAKALLEEAGVRQGTKVTFTFHTQSFTSLPSVTQVLEAVAGNLEAVGLSVERKSVDSDAWMQMMRGGKQPGIFYATSGTPDDGGELINAWFASTSAWTAKSIQVPEYDNIFKQQQQTADPEARKKLLQEFARLESNNLEMVPLFWCSNTYVVGGKVKSWGPALGSGYHLSLNNLELAEQAR